MSLMSMTGFARTSGGLAPWRWVWELKAVNARGLDLRVRVPAGFDVIEAQARTDIAGRLSRGTCYATLTAQREQATSEVRVNESALEALRAAIARVPTGAGLAPASLDGLLAVRGVVEIVDAGDGEDLVAAVGKAMLADLDRAVGEMVVMRRREGAALATILSARLEAMASLTQAAEACPGRQPEAVRERLAQTVAALAGSSPALDPVRLHQEALLLAAKADVREEIDRLRTHVAAARELLAAGTPVGRRLDFLAQELAREANTLCSKSNDAQLTDIGMRLRVEIEQFREQVQNVE